MLDFRLSFGKQPLAVDRDRAGNVFYKMWSSTLDWLSKENDAEKIKIVLQNPAALMVWSLQCDLASLGHYEVWKGDEQIEDDPVLKLLNKPNPMQTGKQLTWDYMFWNMLGQANVYVDSKVPDFGNKIYLLQNDKLQFPTKLNNNKNKLILSNAQYNEIQNTIVKYNQNGDDTFKFKYKKLIQISDLSNGIVGWFDSPSRLDALYKIVSNSELSLRSKGINLDFISKFFVAGKVGQDDVSQMPMGEKDKESVRRSMFTNESVYPTKTMVDVKRFIDDYGVLKSLGESFLADYYLIGKSFGIPRDVLEAYESATYENQEKARASHISYTIQPKMNDLCNALEDYFGYKEQGKEIICTYDHLPFVQVFMKEQAEKDKIKAEALQKLIDSGMNPEDALSVLEYENVRMDGQRNMNNGNNRTENTGNGTA